MKRQFNFRFFAVLVVALVGVAVGGRFLHAYQVKRNANYLFVQSQKAIERDDVVGAFRYLSHYLTLRPNASDARAQFGVLLARQSKTRKEKEQAFLVLDRAFRDQPDLEQSLQANSEIQANLKSENKHVSELAADLIRVRSIIVRVAMDLHQYSDAKAHIEEALKAKPNDARMQVLLGNCEELSGRHSIALEAYAAAIRADAASVDAYLFNAMLLRRLDQVAQANLLIKKMTDGNPDSQRARLAAVKYYRSIDDLASAKANLVAAAAQKSEQPSDDKELLLMSADVAIADGKSAEAREKLELGRKQFPTDPQFVLMLASIEYREKNRSRAAGLLAELVERSKVTTELWAVAELLIDMKELEQARRLVDRLQAASVGDAELKFLTARLYMEEGQLTKAEELFVQCRPHFVRQTYFAIRTELFLASCYERLGKTDLRLKATQAALALDPTSIPSRMSHAAALVAEGKSDEALAIYRSLVNRDPKIRLDAARLVVAQNRARAVKDRSLTLAHELLAGMPLEFKSTVEFHLVRAEALAAEGATEKLAEARRVMELARNKYPQEPSVWIFLAQLAASQSPPEGLSQLTLAGAEIGDLVSFRLVRASLLMQASLSARKPLAASDLIALEADTEKFSEVDQKMLRRGLAEVHLRNGTTIEAERLLRILVDRFPSDLILLTRLFDVVATKSNPDEVASVKEKLRPIEGEDGSIWRFAEAFEMWLRYVKDPQPSMLQHAKTRLGESRKRRPNWAQIAVLEGEIEERLGRTEAALDRYLLAIQQGDRRPDLSARAISLLMMRGRHEEVRQIIESARRWTSDDSKDLNRLEMINLLAIGEDPDRVVKQLEAGAPESSEDYKIHLFRGAFFSELRRNQQAEQAFRRAIALDAKAPACRIALVSFLARIDRSAEAKEEVEKAVRELPSEKKSAALGACYEAIGSRAPAEKYYVEALKENAETSGPLRALAVFYLSGGEVSKAEPILRQLIASNSQTRTWARRTLAMSLASTGDYSHSTESLALLDSNSRENPGDPADLRAKALIQATRPGERRLSIKQLEASGSLDMAEEFMLAQLYELDGDWPKANERFLGLLSRRGGDNPIYIAHYVRLLLFHDDLAGAEVWVKRLLASENRDPKQKGAKSPRVTELQARILVRKGNRSAAATLLQDYAQQTYKELNNPSTLQTVGLLMAELKLIPEAEVMLRQFVAVAEMKTPTAVLTLAEFLARQNRVGEALSVCSKALSTVNPENVARMTVGVVRLGDASPAQYSDAESIILLANQKKPDSVEISTSLADLRDAQGRYDDAKRMYREILNRSPRSRLAMNNLAWLLAIQEGNFAEALQVINRAMESGPEGNLLDTRGVIYLMSGNSEEAIKDLTAAIGQKPNAERFFHLAQAHQRAGSTFDAAREMRRAFDHDLSKQRNLHRLEWKSYDEMLQFAKPK